MSTPTGEIRRYPCTSCGARLEFAPGTTSLRCPYCGATQEIAGPDREIREHGYTQWLSTRGKPVGHIAEHQFVCTSCGARTESDLLSLACSFCGAPMVADHEAGDLIQPEAVLPFGVDTRGAREAFLGWVRSRWFAPNALKRVAAAESMHGTYLPFWTFDAVTDSDYTGARGEHYWDTETYTTTDSEGRTRTETRQVMKTRWWPTSGHVHVVFDDVLVPASARLPEGDQRKLGPWSLGSAVPYRADYLSGFQTVRYERDPDNGLAAAKREMDGEIRGACRRDIGGDEQQVHSVRTSYADVTFKLLLLPVWLATYIHAGRTFQVQVNANTGAVIGERPYSLWKITAAIAAALTAIAVGVTVYQLTR